PIDWLAAFPDAAVKERVARAYLRRSDLTGEEYRAVVASSGAFRLFGAETTDLYKRNLAARHETAAARAAADRAIAGFQTRLSALKTRLYPAPLMAIDKAIHGYANQQHSFIEYLAALEKAAPKDVQWGKYPHLDRLHRLTVLESQMDLRAIADERDLLVRKMAAHIGADDLRRLAERAVEVRGGVLTASRFYEEFLTLADQLRRKGQDMPTRALRNYVGYLNLSESLKHDELMAEADQLRGRLLARYAANDRVWRLVQTDRRVSLERLLWKQEMSPDQYAAFRQEGPLDWPEVDRYLATQEVMLKFPAAVPGDLVWADSLPAVRAFYELALDRDVALVRNTLNGLKNRSETRGVLVAGGFHTPGLTRLLRQSGAGYVVVQPRFEPVEPRRGEDLKISKDLAALGSSATAREMNNLGLGTSELPLQRNIPAQMGAAAAGVAMTSALSMGDKARTYLDNLRSWLKGPASRLGLEIYSAHQLNTPEAKDLIVLYGRARGENFVFAFREGAADRGDRVSLMIGERELDGTDQVNLARRLPGVVESRGLLQWMRDTLGQIRGRTDTAGIQQTIRRDAPSYLTDVLAVVSTAAMATNRPVLENSREGQEIFNATVKAVSAATQRAPTLVSGMFVGVVRRFATRAVAALRPTPSEEAETDRPVVSAPLTVPLLRSLERGPQWLTILTRPMVRLLIAPVLESAITVPIAALSLLGMNRLAARLEGFFIGMHGSMSIFQSTKRGMGVRWIVNGTAIGFLAGFVLMVISVMAGAPFLGDVTAVKAALDIMIAAFTGGWLGNMGGHALYNAFDLRYGWNAPLTGEALKRLEDYRNKKSPPNPADYVGENRDFVKDGDVFLRRLGGNFSNAEKVVVDRRIDARLVRFVAEGMAKIDGGMDTLQVLATMMEHVKKYVRYPSTDSEKALFDRDGVFYLGDMVRFGENDTGLGLAVCAHQALLLQILCQEAAQNFPALFPDGYPILQQGEYAPRLAQSTARERQLYDEKKKEYRQIDGAHMWLIMPAK
ncbi:MAG: hypothetical protein NHG36_02535, partial [Chromatiaceae bacterium]|nr:hypothetical protein [Candidatus Thioaporhodococcus sediminis]